MPNIPRPERRLTILRYVGKTPSFAMCEKCRLKFFTPRKLIHEPVDAEANLQRKFEMHECQLASGEATARRFRPAPFGGR